MCMQCHMRLCVSDVPRHAPRQPPRRCLSLSRAESLSLRLGPESRAILSVVSRGAPPCRKDRSVSLCFAITRLAGGISRETRERSVLLDEVTVFIEPVLSRVSG